MDKYTGKRLDARYEIQELIGVGGMAVVYRAYDSIDDRIVALKILKDEYLGNEEFIRRFKTESNAIAVLSHPNIVKVYDVSFGTKIQYIVMEYIDGIALKEYIAKQKEIKWKEAVYFTQQILLALQHAHDKGVIHRDIKPQNIMLLKDGTIKVTDFGIARFACNDTQTMTDRAIGSVHYIAPEQAKGGITDEKADIYSVGVMLYEMLTGKLPFEADNAVSVAIMQMQTQPKPPRAINESIPEGLEQITLRAMQKNPANRYQQAVDMLLDIEKFQENPSIKFQYKYFVDDNPTRYVDAINDIRSNPKDSYGDDYVYNDEEKKSKSKATIIAGGIAAAVSLFAIIFLFITVFKSCGNENIKDVDVPNFVGMMLSDVQNNSSYNFVWKVESVHDSTKPEGMILDQSPQPSSKKIKEGSTVVLKVNSSGVLVTVPGVKGLTEEIAKAKLSNAGLKSETLMVVDSETAAGIVSGVDPQEGSKVTVDSTVRLYVSKGPEQEKIIMPNVIGKTLVTAKNEIITAKLKVDADIIYEDSDKDKDIVLSTNPLPGIAVDSGSTVKITVSSGVKKEKTVEVNVDLPSTVNYAVTLTTYINGVLDTTKTIVPSYNSNYKITLKGTTGKKMLNVDINGKQYRVYEIDFDAAGSNVKKVSSFEFVGKENTDKNSNSTSSESTSDSSSSNTQNKE